MNPIIVFLIVWIFQLFGHIVFIDDFNDFDGFSLFIIFSGVISFCLAGIIFELFSWGRRTLYFDDKTPLIILIYLKFFSFLYLAIYAIPEIFNLIILNDFGLAREMVNSAVINKDYKIIIGIYFNYIFIIFNIISFSYANRFKKKWIIYLFVIGLASCFLTLGRTMMLLYFISIATMLMMQNILNKKQLFCFFLCFVALFFSIALLMGKGASTGGVVDALIWNLKVYLLSGTAAFNNYIINSEPMIEGYILIPKYLISIINALGFDLEVADLVYPFVEIPYPTNVYTGFFPWYHDFGYLGVLIGFFIIGAITSYFYINRYKSRINMLIHAVSLYPLIMTIFEEQYMKAYILWVMFLFAYLLIKFFEKGR